MEFEKLEKEEIKNILGKYYKIETKNIEIDKILLEIKEIEKQLECISKTILTQNQIMEFIERFHPIYQNKEELLKRKEVLGEKLKEYGVGK